MNASGSSVALDAPRSISQAPTIAPAPAGARTGTSKKLATSTEGARVKTKKRAGANTGGSIGLANTARPCASESCKNVLPPGWKWHRCRACRRDSKPRSVTVQCETCTAAITVSASVAKSGELHVCALCRQRALAAQSGILLPQPPPFSVMGPPTDRPAHQYTHKLVPIPAASSLHRLTAEEAMSLVHPDHLRALHAQQGALPDPHFRPLLPSSAYAPQVRSPPVYEPHYGPRGEILVPRPVSMHQAPSWRSQPPVVRTVAQPFAMPQSGRTPAESIVVSSSGDVHPATQHALGKSSSLSIALEDAVPILRPRNHATIPPLIAHAAQMDDAAPRKRRRTLAPNPPEPPKERTCVSLSCGRVLPPETRGQFCTDCGFLLWRKQFRARVAGLSATVTPDPPKADKGKEKEKVVKPEPGSAANVVVAGWSEPESASAVKPVTDPSSSTSKPIARAVEGERSVSNPRPLTFKLPAKAFADRGKLEGKPLATTAAIVLSDGSSDDEEPLSVVVARKRSSTTPLHETFAVPPPPEPTAPAPPLPVPAPETADPPAVADPELALHVTQAPSTPPLPPTELPPLAQSPEEQKPAILPRPRIRLILHPPRTPPPASSESDEDSSDEDSSDAESSSQGSSSPSSSSGHGVRSKRLTLEDLTRQAALMWDSDESDLTPLEDLTDMGESEVDSEDEVPPTPKDTDLVPQAPWPPPKPPPKPRGICGVTRCMNLLLANTRLRFCHTCAMRKRLLLRHRRQAGTVILDKAEDPGMVVEMPPDGDLTGYRNCRAKHCKRLIPPEATYSYKTCPPCRVDARNRARLSRSLPLDLPDDGDGDDDDDEEDIPLAAALALRKLAARSKKAAKKAPALQTPASSGLEKLLPTVPAYQHFAALLDAFRARFSEFTLAQALYLRFKAQQQQAAHGDNAPSMLNRNPIVFRFDGEYSIVADPSGGLVDALVQCVVRNVQAGLGLNFAPVAVNAGPENSVIAVLRSLYGAQIPLPPAPPAEGTPKGESPEDKSQTGTILVKMVGELQVYVAWDRRHALFPGQRIMVRFRLVG